jgi:hypothetical protein
MATKPIPAGTDLNANGNVSEHHVSWGQHHVCGVRAAHQLPITHIPEGSTPGDSKQGPQENTDPNARSTPEGAGRPDQKRKNNKCEESENIERMNCEEVCEEDKDIKFYIGFAGEHMVKAPTIPQALNALQSMLHPGALFMIIPISTRSAQVTLLPGDVTMNLAEEKYRDNICGASRYLKSITHSLQIPPVSKQKWAEELCLDMNDKLIFKISEVCDVVVDDGTKQRVPRIYNKVVQCVDCKVLCASAFGACHLKWWVGDAEQSLKGSGHHERLGDARFDWSVGKPVIFPDLVKQESLEKRKRKRKVQWTCFDCTIKAKRATYDFTCARCFDHCWDDEWQDNNTRPQEHCDFTDIPALKPNPKDAAYRYLTWCSTCSIKYSDNFSGA